MTGVEYFGLILLGLLVSAFGLAYARGYWWVVLLMAPGLMGVVLTPTQQSNGTAAGFILIILAYALIIPLLTLSGFFYLLGDTIETFRNGGTPIRSIGSRLRYHAPLLLGISIATLTVARFAHLSGRAPGTRIMFAIGAAISLGYVVYRRMEDEMRSEDTA